MNRERLLERFLQYVAIDSTADETQTKYPSSDGQLEVGRLLAEQLKALGADEVSQDQYGLVTALIPGEPNSPTVALNSHVDTSPETSGANIRPQVIADYPGGDIQLPNGSLTITTRENPELDHLVGATLITSDGTTLLGGDDKAGIAVIMELAHHLREHPDIQHAPVRILFTCDEEIGHGVDHVDIEAIGAAVCYTMDGPGACQIDVETFSADVAIVTIQGVNIHPSIAKDRMVNAVRVAAAFVDALPGEERSPESTSDREGFLHPYVFQGGVAETTVRILLRDFDEMGLRSHADLLRETAGRIERQFPGCRIDVEIKRQYRNLGDGLKAEPRAVDLAEQAHARLGRTATKSIIRGGTDGSALTEKGLPTPNLSTGQHNPHSPLEWACLDEMSQAVEVLIELVQLWGRERLN